MTISDPAKAARRPLGAPVPGVAQSAFRDVRSFLKAKASTSGLDQVMEQMNRSLRALPSVVIVGEVGRGKSSLVNVLVGSPNLSPVGNGETTGTYLTFVPPTDDLPIGRARIQLATGAHLINTSELADWVHINGSHLSGPEAVPVLGATVAVESALMPGVMVVDTPGSGGLNEAHARMAISQAETASVLVMVTDVTAPLTTPALDFLGSCSTRVEAVVVAVNKTDLSRSWADRVEETRRSLATRGGQFAGVHVVGISANDAAAAATLPEHVAARARARSGIDELVATVTGLMGNASSGPVIQALNQSIALMEPVVTKLQGDRQAATGDEVDLAELTAKEAQLTALQSVGSDMRYDWDRDCSTLRRNLEVEIDLRLEDFANRWQDQINDHRWGTSKKKQATLAVDLLAELTMIEADVMEGMNRRFAELIYRLYSNIGLAPSPQLMMDLAAERDAVAALNASVQDQGADMDLSMFMSGMMGFSLSAQLGQLGIAGSTLAVGAVALPVVTLVGVACAGVLIPAGIMVRGNQKRRQNLVTFLRERRGTLQRRLTRAYTSSFDLLRSTVRKDFDNQLQEMVTQIRDQMQIAKKAANETRQQRADRLRELDHDIEEAAKVKRTAKDAIIKLRAAALEGPEPA
ncbi:MAG: dynamin family protein [Micrococcales bacterium]|nr:dynamin family protein [Micrococcales bacterium]MCL2667179.1 dynamin family protein [Micrococcales bacterium]